MAQRFKVEFSRISLREFETLRAFDKRQVSDAIEAKLTFDPNVETRDKKCLGSQDAPFIYVPPLWELKIGDFRVFYVVDDAEHRVYIHAVRLKPANKTTREVLNEADGD